MPADILPPDYGSPSVVPFPAPSLADIPAQLRQLAADIEAGRYGPPANVVVVTETPGSAGEPEVFGYGTDCDTLRAVGILQAGAAKLLR